MREKMNKLTHGATRLLVLALGLGLVSTVWAGLPTITVSGNDVTISTDSGSHGNIGTSNGGYDTLTIPAATDLASGTVLRIKSISFGPRTGSWSETQKPPAFVVLAGVSSAAANVTTSGYTDRDKYTYVFTTPCLMKVGTGSTISFRNSSGEQANVGLSASLTASTDQDDYLFTTLRSTSGDNKWSVLTEIVAEKVKGYINETQNGFNTTDTSEKVYVSGVTGYLNTGTSVFGFCSVDELVVVDGEYTFGHKIVNGNSPNVTYPNRGTAFKKLSGTGTITNGDHANQPTPVIAVCDTSEFAGSINIGSGTTRPTILFCTEAEISAGIQSSLGATLQSLFASAEGRSRIYVSSGRTTANNAVVTVPAGKTWTAVNGITNKGELIVDGTVSCNIVNDGTLTINGEVTGSIANSGSGAVTVNAGATLPSFGSMRDFTGFSVNSSVPVKITMSAEEYGKGSLSISGASGISSITVLAPDGTTVVTTLTPENGEAAYNRGSVLVSGKACWYDWEMNGNLNGSGVNTAGLSHDSGSSDQNAFYNSSMLYTYRHPYTSVAFPANWTAVVRCTVPKVVNGTVITFGTKFTSFIGLIAGDDPETEMKLVRYNDGDEAYTVLASMPILDGTSAQHVYIFSVENNSAVKVYCDGSLVLDDTFDAFSLGNGIQIGSAHGGVAGGLVRMWAGDTYAGLTTEDLEAARIDCVRLYDYSLSAAQIEQLSVEFPAVKLYRATVADGAATDWGSLNWTNAWDGGNAQSKIILTVEGDASLTLTNSITADEFVINVPSANVLTLSKFASGTTLTVTKPIEVAGGTVYFSAEQFAGLGNLNFGGTGTIRLGDGVAVTSALSGSAKVNIASGDTVGVVSDGSIANPITGAGVLTYQFASGNPSALTLGDWTGTVVLKGISSGIEVNLNNYGKTGSTVQITGLSNGAYLANAAIAPTVDLGGNMTLAAFSASFANTINKLTGSGVFSLAANGTAQGYVDGYFLIKDVSDFTGSITVAAPGLALGGTSKPSSSAWYGKIVVQEPVTVGSGATWSADGVVLYATTATLTVPDGATVPSVVSGVAGYKVDADTTTTSGSTVYSLVAKGATVSGVTFDYGKDFATATVRATVSGDATTYTLTVGTTDYPGVVDGSTVTFSGVATGHAAAYDNVDYTIAATDGTSPVTVSGGSGAAPVADVTADWINERAASATGTSASAEGAGGMWTNAVTYTDGKATISDNRFVATEASTASRVVLEFNVCFSSTSDEDVSGEAQAAIKLAEVNSVTTFMVLTNGNNWAAVSNAELTPDASATYKVVLTIDYGNNTYGVTVGNYVMTNSTGSASFSLATSKATVQNIDFVGSGTLTSMKGDQIEGYMVKDGQNHFYATIEAATQAYNSANGPYTVLHDGTAPSGWKIDNITKVLTKIAKGLFFMAY